MNFATLAPRTFGLAAAGSLPGPVSAAPGLLSGLGSAIFSSGGLGIAAMIGQGLLQGVQNKKAAKRQAKDFLAQAAEYGHQKRELRRQARAVDQIGAFEELEFRQQAHLGLDSVESVYADAGVAPTGSAVDVMMAMKRRYETEALKIRKSTATNVKSILKQAKAASRAQDRAEQNAAYARDAADHAFFGLF